MWFVVILGTAALLSGSSMASAKTWHLQHGQDWEQVSAQGQDRYLLAVAEIKQLVAAGRTGAVAGAYEKLKKDFPEIAGPDLDAFIEAEIFFSRGKFTKAVRAYDRLLVEFSQSRLYEAALDRQFSIATAFLAGRKRSVLGIFKMRGYAEGVRIMEKITDRAGTAPIGVKADVAVAENYERRGKFDAAYSQWSLISSRYGGTGRIAKEALLAMARCKHAAYEGQNYDVSNLVSAKSYYENFRLRYPEDAKAYDIDKIIVQIDGQLAYKQFSIGRYYQRTGNKQSANLYYQMVLDDWPQTTAAKMAEEALEYKEPSGEKEKKWKEKTIEKLEEWLL
jgi:outer membrane protein assembly factor BamD (BamD/ComL family)